MPTCYEHILYLSHATHKEKQCTSTRSKACLQLEKKFLNYYCLMNICALYLHPSSREHSTILQHDLRIWCRYGLFSQNYATLDKWLLLSMSDHLTDGILGTLCRQCVATSLSLFLSLSPCRFISVTAQIPTIVNCFPGSWNISMQMNFWIGNSLIGKEFEATWEQFSTNCFSIAQLLDHTSLTI